MSNRRFLRPGRCRVILAMLLSVAAACGGSEESIDATLASEPVANEPAPATVASPTSTAATTSTSTTVAPVVSAPQATEVPAADAEPVVVPFPAAALPILNRYPMDQPVWTPMGFDDELVFAHGLGIGRLDLTDGSVTTRPLAAGDEPKAELFYAVSDGTTFVGVADVAGQGTVDLVVTIDPETLERIGQLSSTPPAKVLPWPASGPAPRLVVASGTDGFQSFDVQNTDLVEPITFVDPSAPIHTNSGELWTWTADGLVQVYDERGAVIGTVDTGLRVGQANGAATLISPTSLWLTDLGTAELVRIDRAEMEVTHALDLREHFSWADAVRLRQTNTTDRYLLANAVVGDEGWWLLVEVDPEMGVVLSEHVLATDSFEYGWNAFDGPEIATVGDRLFIRDHLRRIVEVDVAALGQPSPVAWSNPGIGRAPELSAEEQVIADLTLQLVNDGRAPGFTDPVLGPLVLDVLATVRDEGVWEIVSAEVVGDRGVARAAPVSESLGSTIVFRRVDGEWLLDVDDLCALARQAGPCAPG